MHGVMKCRCFRVLKVHDIKGLELPLWLRNRTLPMTVKANQPRPGLPTRHSMCLKNGRNILPASILPPSNSTAIGSHSSRAAHPFILILGWNRPPHPSLYARNSHFLLPNSPTPLRVRPLHLSRLSTPCVVAGHSESPQKRLSFSSPRKSDLSQRQPQQNSLPQSKDCIIDSDKPNHMVPCINNQNDRVSTI